MKTTKIAIVLLIICQTVFAQKNKLAVINDPDGYTNIRSGKGTSFEIVDKIYDSEVFHFVDIPNEQWLEVNITKCACDG